MHSNSLRNNCIVLGRLSNKFNHRHCSRLKHDPRNHEQTNHDSEVLILAEKSRGPCVGNSQVQKQTPFIWVRTTRKSSHLGNAFSSKMQAAGNLALPISPALLKHGDGLALCSAGTEAFKTIQERTTFGFKAAHHRAVAPNQAERRREGRVSCHPFRPNSR